MSEFFLISPRDYAAVKAADCWPKECMEAHGAGGRKTEYIGSYIEDDNKIRNYWIDEAGSYWFTNSFRKEGGKNVDEETGIFGKKVNKKRPR